MGNPMNERDAHKRRFSLVCGEWMGWERAEARGPDTHPVP